MFPEERRYSGEIMGRQKCTKSDIKPAKLNIAYVLAPYILPCILQYNMYKRSEKKFA